MSEVQQLRLKEARLNRGLSQGAAADKIGVSQGILQRAESGLGIRPAHAKQIADFYEKLVTDLFPLDPHSEDADEERAA